MKILGLIGPTGGCYFYRHLVPAHLMNKRGHDFRTTNVIFEEMFSHIDFQPDVVYCQRVDSPRVLNILHKWGIPWIYDIDDNYVNIPEGNPSNYLKKHMPRIKLFMENSKLITVTTKELSSLYSSYGKVKVIKNTIPEEWKTMQPSINRSPMLTIGWAGSMTHGPDLAIVRKALTKLNKKYNFQIFFFGYIPDWALSGFKSVYIRPVPIEKYIDTLLTLPLDIAIAPLVDNKFNRAKSNIKILEYGLCGFPVVASDVGEYSKVPSEVVIKAKNTTEDWYNALEKLIKDDSRRRLGMKLRDWVFATHTSDQVADEWEEAFLQTSKSVNKEEIDGKIDK